ncbi:hypothetical protein HDU98_008762 [Podochytrium sp. JEL0797]|nr:hypothetical protein HDU98_008762 [Podochytrium sp. JEL0797]
MSTFALAVLGLTLPSLASQNYQHLGLASPPLTPSFIHKCMLLRVGVTANLEDMRIVSPAYTVFTHMFHHKNLQHWFSNMYALVVLTAGQPGGIQSFLQQTATFVGGGLGGVFGHLVYATLQKRRQDRENGLQPTLKGLGLDGLGLEAVPGQIADGVNWAFSTLTGDKDARVVLGRLSFLSERTVVLCGCSAGVYALMGAECVRISIELYVALRRLAILQRRPYLDPAGVQLKIKIQNQIVGILTVAIGHVVAIGSQVVAVTGLMENNGRGTSIVQTGDGYSIVQTPHSGNGEATRSVQLIDENVGYAAHLGGFLFGVVAQIIRAAFL